MRRILISGIPIVGLWLATVLWLGVREGWWLETVAAHPMASQSVSPQTSRLRVMLGGEAVGTVETARTIAEDGSLRSTLSARLAVPLFGFETPVELDLAMTRPATGPDGTVIEARAQAVAETVEVAARLEGGTLRGTVTAAGESVPLDVPIDRDLLIAGGLGPLTYVPPLGVGERVRITAVDPLTLGTAPVRLRGLGFERLSVGGRTIDTRVVAVEGRAFDARLWLDAGGDLVRAETPIGLVLERVGEAGRAEEEKSPR